MMEDRPLTLARELTKQFEQITTLPAREAGPPAAAGCSTLPGEFVVVLHPVVATSDSDAGLRVLDRLLQVALKSAVRLAAEHHRRLSQPVVRRGALQRKNLRSAGD